MKLVDRVFKAIKQYREDEDLTKFLIEMVNIGRYTRNTHNEDMVIGAIRGALFDEVKAIKALSWHNIVGRGDVAVIGKSDKIFKVGQMVIIDDILCRINAIEISNVEGIALGVRKLIGVKG